MGYITDEKMDLKDISTIMRGGMPEDDSPFINAINLKQVEAAMFTFRDHIAMRQRKQKKEEESYKIANTADFGWSTEKAYRQEPVFEDDEEDLSWWHKPELLVEKKKEKMRAAERDVKFKLSNNRPASCQRMALMSANGQICPRFQRI